MKHLKFRLCFGPARRSGLGIHYDMDPQSFNKRISGSARKHFEMAYMDEISIAASVPRDEVVDNDNKSNQFD